MFNRRHYEFVAEIIKAQRQSGQPDPHGVLDSLAWRFADAFGEDNTKHDKDRFFNATVEGVNRRTRNA